MKVNTKDRIKYKEAKITKAFAGWYISYTPKGGTGYQAEYIDTILGWVKCSPTYFQTREKARKFLYKYRAEIPIMKEKETDKGTKYLKHIKNKHGTSIQVDVYDVLVAFKITCPATAHAMKKIMCAGQRGAKSYEEDINEAIVSLQRAKQLKGATPSPSALGE